MTAQTREEAATLTGSDPCPCGCGGRKWIVDCARCGHQFLIGVSEEPDAREMAGNWTRYHRCERGGVRFWGER